MVNPALDLPPRLEDAAIAQELLKLYATDKMFSIVPFQLAQSQQEKIPMQLQNSSSKPSDVLIQGEQAIATQTIQTWLVNQLAKQLSIPAQTVKVEEPLTRYGLDSIDSVTIVGDMEDWLGVDLPSTLLWDYPTIEKAAKYLVQEMEILPAAVETTETAAQPTAPAGKGWGGLFGRGK